MFWDICRKTWKSLAIFSNWNAARGEPFNILEENHNAFALIAFTIVTKTLDTKKPVVKGLRGKNDHKQLFALCSSCKDNPNAGRTWFGSLRQKILLKRGRVVENGFFSF